MKINLSELPAEEPLEVAGQADLSSEAFDLPYPDSWAPLDYQFTALRTGDECLVRGTLKTSVTRECERCLDPLPTPIEPDFVHTYEIRDLKAIDLTPDVREDILLSLPMAFRCELDANLCCPISGRSFRQEGPDEFEDLRNKETWKELDNLGEN